MNTEKNPWKLISSEMIYDNPWIRLTEHKVINPAGGPGIYGMVHFKNLAIGVVPYEAGMIWLVGQYRLPLEKYSWEIPEGGGPHHEDPLEAARRELREETGLEAEHYEVIVRMDLSNSVSDERAIVFLATGLKQGKAEPEDTEQLLVEKVSLDEAYARVEQGEISDSLTVAAIYKLMLMKASGKLGH